MTSPRCAELQSMANNLEYSFFVCSENLTEIYYPSDPFLRLIDIRKEELLQDPSCWRNRIKGGLNLAYSALATLKNGAGKAKIEIPFQWEQDDSRLIRIRFCGRCHEEGQPYFLGSAELLSDKTDYKQEALQLRDHEIEISARIQKTLLTGEISQTSPAYDVAAESLPSQKIDGDFYDFLSFPPDMLDFIIGDVMGKGVPAALLAAAVKAVFFKSFITGGVLKNVLPSIKEVLTEMDGSLSQDLSALGKFLTLYYCRMDLKNNLLNFIDAGHTSFIYYDETGKSTWSIKGANMPLGFSQNQDFRTFLLPLRRNDLLFFYSDGISEVKGRENDLFGLERIIRLVDAHHYLSPQELIKKILNVAFFYSLNEIEDDVTAIAIRIKKDSPPPLVEKKRHFNRSDPIDLEAIREELTQDLERTYSNRQEETRIKLLISFMETLANCISYTQGDIRVSWNLYDLQTEISLTFEGPEFDWFNKQSPSIDRYPRGGFGSYLINQGTDSALLLESLSSLKRIILVKEMV